MMKKPCGRTVLGSLYNNSLPKALEEVYPNHEWHWWKFPRTPADYWLTREHQRRFFDWLAAKQGLKSLDEFYQLTAANATANGAEQLMALHHDSIFSALSFAYPEHRWQPWKFPKTSRHFWQEVAQVLMSQLNTPAMDDPNAQQHRIWARDFLDYIASQVGVRELTDWYRISPNNHPELQDVVVAFGGLPMLLTAVYPDHQWDHSLFSLAAKRSVQYAIIRKLERAFPNTGMFLFRCLCS